jgi:hypothetical protein
METDDEEALSRFLTPDGFAMGGDEALHTHERGLEVNMYLAHTELPSKVLVRVVFPRSAASERLIWNRSSTSKSVGDESPDSHSFAHEEQGRTGITAASRRTCAILCVSVLQHLTFDTA